MQKQFGKEIILLDGAMGTMLVKHHLNVGKSSEIYNITHPELIENIHLEYLQAGSDVIYANTFGISSLKNVGYSTQELVQAGIAIAKRAAEPFGASVALDVGPLGELLAPLGDLTFDEAYGLFAEKIRIGAEAGADLIAIETMTDLYEMKAAVLAAKENTDLPIIATMSFEQGGKTFTGAGVCAMAVTLSALGVNALGVNCSLGPAELLPVVKRMLPYTDLPIAVKANAGLPVDGNYTVTAKEFAEMASEFLKIGVSVLGGCCGTTPEFVRQLSQMVKQASFTARAPIGKEYICSSSEVLDRDGNYEICDLADYAEENVLAQMIAQRDGESVQEVAFDLMDDEPEILQIDFDRCGVSECADAKWLVQNLCGVVRVPFALKGSSSEIIAAAERAYHGVCLRK